MWSKAIIEQVHDNTARLSIAFTWHLPQAYQRAVWHKTLGRNVIAGGPAVALMPAYLTDVAEIGDHWSGALQRHNPSATRTSTGCPHRCPFCAVPQTEGHLKELSDWPILPIVCDNNLLACSKRHFDRVIDSLKPLSKIDFNQGLDARHLTKHHASRLAELNCTIRLAFDHTSRESILMAAYEKLRSASIPKRAIRVYVLIGYNDTPADALYRLQLIRDLGITPNPMRYNPLDTIARDSHVPPNWTHSELARYTRYWSNLRYFGAIPFEHFHNTSNRRSRP